MNFFKWRFFQSADNRRKKHAYRGQKKDKIRPSPLSQKTSQENRPPGFSSLTSLMAETPFSSFCVYPHVSDTERLKEKAECFEVGMTKGLSRTIKAAYAPLFVVLL